MGNVSHVTEEAVIGQQVIKVFQGQEAEKDRFASRQRENPPPAHAHGGHPPGQSRRWCSWPPAWPWCC